MTEYELSIRSGRLASQKTQNICPSHRLRALRESADNGDDIAGHHQFSRVENFPQVPISRNHSCRHCLKIRLRRLGLHHQLSEFHVDLGAVGPTTAEWNFRPESNCGTSPEPMPSMELKAGLLSVRRLQRYS
jgi:hypothetical protein